MGSPPASCGGRSLGGVLLHGKLVLTISRARNVAKARTTAEDILNGSPCMRDKLLSKVGTSFVDWTVGVADKLLAAGSKLTETVSNHGDPYVVVDIAGARVARTSVKKSSENPQWDETFSIYVAHHTSTIDFTIKDDNRFGAGVIGSVRVPVQALAVANQVKGGSFEVLKPDGSRYPGGCMLDLGCHYKPAQSLPGWRTVFGLAPAGQMAQIQDISYLRPDSIDAPGVPGAYFPMRRGCRVTLYQAAHVPDGALPEDIKLDGGRTYRHGRCWEDICAAILGAKHMIYIVGWSVNDKIKLVRDPARPMGDGSQLTLGKLLKKKAATKVKVVLMIWDERTSRREIEFLKGGFMKTRDEETEDYFRHSDVKPFFVAQIFEMPLKFRIICGIPL
ncbi:hypothetical protein CBR_g48599 [Chara braunii]|uniref:C2 domain-containing protein n=1 Tax=Chara braunii TaxID=69332 RepID=A0A388M3D9_CHABU|nr:hypothetical protein CBR_g48599 [Chara braunii]|eukprot:GBG88989.1 hypothetical protein CBR_g48599 [Chara braunii]